MTVCNCPNWSPISSKVELKLFGNVAKINYAKSVGGRRVLVHPLNLFCEMILIIYRSRDHIKMASQKKISDFA